MSSDPHPTVSVIIPAYRAARTVGRAVDSLLSQTRTPDEILVIDDGSPDDLAAALTPYGERVRLVRQANGGAASARNRGIDLATGEWIAFLDADDYWERGKLERQLAVLQSHPKVGLVAAHYYLEPPGKPRYPNSLPPPQHLDRVLTVQGPETLAVARKIWTSTVLVRRTVLGDRRFDTTLATAEDVDLWVRLVLIAPVYFLAEPLATAVLEAGSLSRSDVAADSRNMLTVVRRHAIDPRPRRRARLGEARLSRVGGEPLGQRRAARGDSSGVAARRRPAVVAAGLVDPAEIDGLGRPILGHGTQTAPR